MKPAPSMGAADCGPLNSPKCLRFPDTELSVQLSDAPDVEIALSMALKAWTPSHAELSEGARVSSVARDASGYTTRSVYLNEVISGLGVAGAACAVIADLAQDYFETRPGCLALHCAAFRYNQRLIAVTGPTRAGKSTLAARMTQEPDVEVFCDDVLPLPSDGIAVGLGIAPRLRLPLPESVSPKFRAHVARHLGPRDDRYGYLCAPNVAPHGTRAPMSVLLILDRRDAATARLHSVAEDEALHFLLSQNMSNLHTPQAAYARLTNLLDGLTCLRLVYADLEEAVALIRRAFGTPAALASDVELGPMLPVTLPTTPPVADCSTDICWSRNPDVIIQTKAEGAFLWQTGKQMIWHLNTLGLAVWALLEIPGSASEIGATLHEHFPDQHPRDLIRDVNTLLLALSQDGLIERTTNPISHR